MMREFRRSRRRTGFILSRCYTMTMKGMLLERATRKGRLWKSKDTVQFERLSVTNLADRRKRKFTRLFERRDSAKRARSRNNSDGSSSGMDYISELPDCVIHNILSFLHAREAARMSVLSNRWRLAWCSFPQLDIDHRYFRQHGGDWVVKLKNHIDNVLQKLAFQMVNIDKFRLCVTRDPVVKILTDTWIEGATERNVKELHIQVRPVLLDYEDYRLPPSILSITTLAVLSLHGCNLETCNNIKLPLLRKLSLKKLRVSDLLLQDFICSCPLIEELRLIGCMELRCVNISAPTRLQKFHLYQCKDLVSVKIAAPVLQSLWLRQTNQGLGLEPPINLIGCTGLKEVVMEYPKLVIGDLLQAVDVMEHPEITGSILVNYKFPFLEKLVLIKSRLMSNMQISGEKLTKLSLIDLPQLDLLFICAPQLIYLEYKGKDIPITLVGPMNIREVNLSLKQRNVDAKDCKYHELLRTLGKRGDLKLLIEDKSEVTIQENMRTIFRPLTIGFNVRTIKVSTSIEYLIEGLLTARKYPSKISLFSHEGSKLHKAIYDKFNDGRKDLNCCSYLKSKCWRHYLREVTCEWSKVKWSQIFCNLEAPLQPNDDWLKTCFALHWESDETSRSVKNLDD